MAESCDLSQMQTDSDGNLDDTVKNHDDAIQSIINEIIELLQLNDNKNKDQIITNLLENGRQSLYEYREDIAPEIYTTEMNTSDSKLIELLKMYFQQKWKIQYGSSNEWFSIYLQQNQSGENHDLYESVLIRTADYGNKYMKNCPILSLVLQLLFEAIDDKCLQETNIFNDLWLTITNDGLKSITKYADYIIEDVMNEQINNKNSPLSQALREYYRSQLFLFLQQSNIKDRQNLYDCALDNVTEHGWLTGVQAIKKKTTTKFYEKLLENIQSYQQTQEGRIEYSNDHNTPSINMELELNSTERPTTQNGTCDNKDEDTSTISVDNFKLTTTDIHDAHMEDHIRDNNEIIAQTSTYINDQNYNTTIHSIHTNTQMTSEYQTIASTIVSHDNRKELTMILNSKYNESDLFKLENLIQAGELQYINQTLDNITQNLVDNFNYKKQTFSKFIQDCLIPIMYLLKRQQNLDDFFISLTFKYSQGIEHLIERTNLNLRMLLHVLFMNSNIFLQRILMSLLSKRNPVPFISLNTEVWNQDKQYEFMPAIIHVWNYTRPTILSFGIGPCKGKSTLLNELFQSTFEQTADSIYFQQTIDIDFGYCFNPERILNIADTHGFIDKQLLEEIQSLFDGFLIQIDKTYFDQQPQILIEYLKVLPEDKFQMVIIRDTPINNIQECSSAIRNLSKHFRMNFSQNLHIYPLVNISSINDRNIGIAIRKIREELLIKIKSKVRITNDKYKTLSNLKSLMKGNYIEYVEQLNRVIEPLKNQLKTTYQHGADQNFPLYLKFQELCKLRQKLKKLDFYGSESENMFQIYEKLHKLENELDPNTKMSVAIENGYIFDLFIEILKSNDTLLGLDLLSTELKTKLLSLGGDKIAGDLTTEYAFLSLEVLWRNAIVCYNHTTKSEQDLITNSYCNFIAAGYPFEIIDGDNLHFQHQFLSQVLKKFESQRILVVSIIGPQNSGKSTLLNYMFGTLFDVREGRCTRGIYGSLVRLAKSNQTINSLIPDIDYIMLIDTEGLLSIEKSDNEYDRRLVLFCLAVSHLVIVNMMGDVNETLKDMLTLCADSLRQIGVNKVNQPIVHFVLNQKADPNLKNHTEAIDRIIRDFKDKGLADVLDINSETFHTLPSAFNKKRVSNDAQSACFLRTEPDFIQCTQRLCEKIIRSAKPSYGRSGETFSDPLQWLKTAVNVFDTLEKFPDLTYFKDINERRQDDRIRQHIGELISKTLPSDYRQQMITDLCELTENEIRKQFQAKFDVHQNNLDNELKIIFKTTNASERIRERCTQFLKRQVTEISNAWCTAALQAHDQKQMEVLVRDGSDDLRKLIDDLIKNGQIMTKEKATEEFEIMWNKKLKSINRDFDPQERLKQAIKFVYGNYNIFEKQCLPSHAHILDQLPFIARLTEQSNVEFVVTAIQKQFAENIFNLRQHALEAHWKPSNTDITYTLATIDNFSHLSKQILKDFYLAGTYCEGTYTEYRMDQDANTGQRMNQHAHTGQEIDQDVYATQRMDYNVYTTQEMDQNAYDRHGTDHNAHDRQKRDQNAYDRHRTDQNAYDRHRTDHNVHDRHRTNYNAHGRHRTNYNAHDRQKMDQNAYDRHRTDHNAYPTRRTDHNADARQKMNRDAGTRQRTDHNAYTTQRTDRDIYPRQRTDHNADTTRRMDHDAYARQRMNRDADTAWRMDRNADTKQKMDQDDQNRQSSKKQKTNHPTQLGFLRKSLNFVSSYLSFGPLGATSTEQTTPINKPAQLQIDFIHKFHSTIHNEMKNSPNAVSNILCIPILFNKIVEATLTIVIGNSAIRRPIEVDLIQKIVGLINTIMNEINLELLVFKLSLSKQAKSSIHTFILILLTMFYYDEQKHHFDQQISTLNKEKPSLLTYFISMVVPDAQCDNEGGELFTDKIKNAIESSLMRDAQIIITRIIATQQNLNRKQIQIICDGKLHAAADDDDWLFRYIDAPTDIIIEEFQILWQGVEKTINQQLAKEKNQWKNILIEFFNRMEYIISSLVNEGSSVQFINDIFSASGGIAADNLTNKGQCMVLLLYDYLSGNKIEPGTSYTVFNETYTLNTKGLKLFEKLPVPSQQLANVINGMKDIDTANNNRTPIASIKNLHIFLKSIMYATETILDTYDKERATFTVYDKDQSYNKLLDKVRGCTSKCPCCQRPCDVDHTLIKSNAGDEDNRHCCQTGHQLRAMAGIKFEISNEASLFQCEQMTDDSPIVTRGTKKKWSEFKADYPDWDFGNLITPDELFKLRGKFLNVWSRIGERLCEKYDMEFVTENTAHASAKSFHYILLLDASGSMQGLPWKNLLDGAKEFIKIRTNSGSPDRMTIIVFDSHASYAYFNEDIKFIDINQIKFTNGGTDFGNAFDLVIKTIQNTQVSGSTFDPFGHPDYIVIFMSDGQAEFPHSQMEQLSSLKYVINQFWTVALGKTSMSVLQQINDKMGGTFKELKDSADFVCVYAEIARN